MPTPSGDGLSPSLDKGRAGDGLPSAVPAFNSAGLQLVIDIDGDSHAETAEYDAERTRFFGSLGLRVIRFSNDDVLLNIEGVYEELNRTITAINSGGGSSRSGRQAA